MIRRPAIDPRPRRRVRSLLRLRLPEQPRTPKSAARQGSGESASFVRQYTPPRPSRAAKIPPLSSVRPTRGVRLTGRMADPSRDQEKAEERSSPSAHVVYEAIRKEGRHELERKSSSLAWSGLAAGMS